jgi:general stress protein YciG
MADTSDRGLGSANMSEEEKNRIQSAGGKAQPKEVKREAGKKGGSRSRRS